MTQAVFADDPRRPIERLRRSRLWKIADAYGITYPKDAPKDVMIQVLEGAGVDVTRPAPNGDAVPWKQVPVKQEDGTVTHQLHPDEPQAGGLDNAELSRILEAKAKEEEAKQEKLKAENEDLSGQLRELMEMNRLLMERVSALEGGQEEPEKETQKETLNLPKGGNQRLQALRRACKERGIAFARTDKMRDLERKLGVT